MIWAVFQALLSHWRKRPFQLLTLIVGLSLATALWSGVQAINAESRKSYDEAARILNAGTTTQLVRADGDAISSKTFVALRRAGWLVSPVVDGWLPTSKGRVRLLGIDPFTVPFDTVLGGAVDTGSIAEISGNDGAILANASTAAQLTEFGDRITVVDDIAPGLAVADITVAQDLSNSGGFTRLFVLDSQPMIRPELSEVAPQLRIEAPETAEDLGRLTDSFHLNLTAFGLLSFAVGLFIVNGAVGLAFEQRRPVFRTLRALGVPSSLLVIAATFELLLFALLSGVFGILMGYMIAAALLPDVAATLRGLYGANVEGTLSLSPAWWLSGIVIACLGTAIAASGGLLRLARMPPLAPARPRAWVVANEMAMRWQLVGVAVCFATAVSGMLLGGLLGGFVLLGGFLLGAALALPSVLSALITLAARFSRTPLSEWFWADTRQQLPGLSLALMALMLALAANIGVSTMVSSFRATFTGWLDQRLVSDVYVTVEDEADAPALMAFLDGRVDAVLPIWNVEAQVLGAPAEIYGVVNNPIYSENWPLLDALPDTWDRIAAGEGALVNEQLARRENLVPGDALEMPGGWQTTVNGIYSDYGNPQGQVVVPLEVLTARYDAIDRNDFGLLIPDEAADDLKKALVQEFGLPEENLVDQAALKGFSLSIFERTFAVTGALNALTLAVAGVAILTSLLTLAAMRLPQLAPIWALGMTRAQLARIELIRALVLAFLTFLFALPVGLGLAWVLLAVVNVEAFGWRLPMLLFPSQWLWLFVLSLAAAGLASLWPARQLVRRPPAELIRVFTHER